MCVCLCVVDAGELCSAQYDLPYAPQDWAPYSEGALQACCAGEWFVDQVPGGITCYGLYAIRDLGCVC